MQVRPRSFKLCQFFRLLKYFRVIDNAESCLMGELELCDEKSISYVFKHIFDFFKQQLDCADHSKVNISSNC